MKVCTQATDGVERRELEQPRAALSDAGADTQLLSLKPGTIDARDHDLQPAGEFTVDREVSDASVDDFHALVIPGGTVNADKLRTDRAAVAFVHDFVESGKPVGVICHGPWTLVEAGVVNVVWNVGRARLAVLEPGPSACRYCSAASRFSLAFAAPRALSASAFFLPTSRCASALSCWA